MAQDAGIEILSNAYQSSFTCWTCRSIDCIQWKLDECWMFCAIPLRLEKNLSQVERSSSPKPGRYNRWYFSWQEHLWAQQWNTSTTHWRCFLTTSSFRELLQSVTLRTQLMSYPRPWSSLNTSRIFATVVRAYLALHNMLWTESVTLSFQSSKLKVPQVNPVIRPTHDPEKQETCDKLSGDLIPHDQSRSKSPDISRVLTRDKSQDQIRFGQARSPLINRWQTIPTVCKSMKTCDTGGKITPV